MSAMINSQLDGIASAIGSAMTSDHALFVRRSADALCCSVDVVDDLNARLGLVGENAISVSPYVRRSLKVLCEESARFAAAA